jgi:hypothetical protein
MKRLSRVLVKMLSASAVLTLFFASAAMAGEELDQTNTCSKSTWSQFKGQQPVAQTFTAGKSGFITTAAVYIDSGTVWPSDKAPVKVELQAVGEDGFPTGEVLAVASIPGEQIVNPSSGFTAFTFTHSPSIEAGERYALVLLADIPADEDDIHTYSLGITSEVVTPECSGYSQGQWMRYLSDTGWDARGGFGESWDLIFKTHVTPDTVKPTGTVLINNGATHTTTRLVTLNLSATDAEAGSGVTEMRFKNGGADTAWSAWEPYAETKSWRLTSGEGKKKVAVQYRDAAGNRSTPVYDYILFRR